MFISLVHVYVKPERVDEFLELMKGILPHPKAVAGEPTRRESEQAATADASEGVEEKESELGPRALEPGPA